MRRLIAVLAMLSMAACGPADWAPNTPDCDDVWVEGNKLPKNYDGCQDNDTRSVEGGTTAECDGFEIVSYENKGHGYFTDKQRIIHDGGEQYAGDPLYMKLNESC